jgi:hypothetical protein
VSLRLLGLGAPGLSWKVALSQDEGIRGMGYFSETKNIPSGKPASSESRLRSLTEGMMS